MFSSSSSSPLQASSSWLPLLLWLILPSLPSKQHTKYGGLLLPSLIRLRTVTPLHVFSTSPISALLAY